MPEEKSGFKCEECEALPVCRGWCPSEGIDERDSFLAVPYVVCRFNKAIYKLVRKYQKDILEAKNLRSRHLNIIKANLELEREFNEMKKIDVTTSEFAYKLSDFYGNIKFKNEILLPSFRAKFMEELSELERLLGGITNAE
jgi:hypothetical protein